MAERHSVTEAIYHPIPQAPVASNPIPSASPDPDVDDETILSSPRAAHGHVEVDGRIRWIHFLLGCAVLLPWNGTSQLYWQILGYLQCTVAIITATPYFLSRLDGTPLKSTFSSYLSTTFTAANFGFLAHATATAKKV